MERARLAAEEHGLEFVVTVDGKSIYTDPNSRFVNEVLDVAGRDRPTTVSYGTDGAKLTALEKLVVCGPGSIAQAHTHDEWIALEQLEKGTDLYSRLIRHWCS
ncbi:MAG: M20/M25/M40 family metallo-hydrolase [Planctomycetota bacterium]|nr:M20/M25/M40 family metallo-hydrolase [Planctomycetota bacterium]